MNLSRRFVTHCGRLTRNYPVPNNIIRRQMSVASDPSTSSTLRLGICQISVGADKPANIVNARRALEDARVGGAQLAVLPECWNSPYSTSSFPVYAEPVPEVGMTAAAVDPSTSPSIHMVVQAAIETGMWVIGGSIPERRTEVNSGKEYLYNTCIVVNPQGKIVGKHRKVHLFDIDVPGRITFKESDSLTGGNSVTVVDTPWGGGRCGHLLRH